MAALPHEKGFIQDIVASKSEGEDAYYFAYLSALFEYEFLLGFVFVLSGFLCLVSVFCGFFFVLMRMVGAFGGRKVQNITAYYMLALNLHTASMTLTTGLNAVSLAWLYGSSNRLHMAHDYSVKVMHEGHGILKSHITDGLNNLKNAVENARLTRKELADSVDTYHKEYLNDIQKHSSLVLEKAGLPSEKQANDLNDFCDKVSQDQQVPQEDRSKYSSCATASADLVSVAQTAAQQIEPLLRKAVEDYNRGGPAFKDLQPSNVWKDSTNKLVSLISQVSSAKFPLISDFDVLGRLSLYDGIFEYGLDYISQVCVGACLLQALAAFSYAVGTWVHDPEIPPNKRGFVSNQAGITLVVSTLFMWVFTTFMIPASIVYMLSGVIAANYICYPYQYGGDGGLSLLDNVTASLYVQGERNYIRNTNYALFNSTYKMGQVLRKCNITMPLVNLSTHPDIVMSSIAFTAHVSVMVKF
ncbi:uncharacterized protein LOC144105120 [Amblyomma americanum]